MNNTILRNGAINHQEPSASREGVTLNHHTPVRGDGLRVPLPPLTGQREISAQRHAVRARGLALGAPPC